MTNLVDFSFNDLELDIYGRYRVVFLKKGILAQANKFCSFTLLGLQFVSAENVNYKIDCIFRKLGYVGSTSKQARTTWEKHKYDIKSRRIGQCGLTNHLHKRVHHNQSFEQKLGNLRMF